MSHFIPTTTTVTAEGLATLFRDWIWRLHGIPKSIISDRGAIFTSKFWKTLSQMVGLQTNLSTAFHPQTDGQTERTNASLEQYLHIYCNYQQDNWSQLLSSAEYAYNNTKSATTGMTPFFANYGFHPTWQFDLKKRTKPPAPEIVKNYVQNLKNLLEYLQLEIRF